MKRTSEILDQRTSRGTLFSAGRLAGALLCAPLLFTGSAHADWPAFRGADAGGLGDGEPVVTWNVETGDGIRWKVPVPGLSHSSPIVTGDLVVIATAVSLDGEPYFRSGLYGDVDLAEDDGKFSWRMLAYDRATGAKRWERTLHEGEPLVQRHIKATHSNSTPVTDGKRIVAVFGSIGQLYCLDLEGKVLWRKELGGFDTGWFYDASYQWGHASSPVIWKDRIFLQVDQAEGSFLAAFRLSDGAELWRTPRNNLPSWGTPTVVESASGAEVVANGAKAIRGYDAKTGKELWSLGPTSEVTVATPVVAHGLVYISHGYRPVQPVYAIRPGGRGDLTLPDGESASDHIAWSHPRGGNYITTPIVVGPYLYTLANNGVLTAYDAKTGERLFRERVGGGQAAFSGSMVSAAGRLYLPSEDGDVYVVAAEGEYRDLGSASVGEVIMTTPAIDEGLLIVRGRSHLFGLGSKPAAAPSKAPAEEASKGAAPF